MNDVVVGIKQVTVAINVPHMIGYTLVYQRTLRQISLSKGWINHS